MVLNDAVKSVEQLRSQVTGSVITPQDADYEQARRAWNLLLDQHPVLIVIPQNVQDVVAAVRYAGEAGLTIGVQSTGHGVQQPADNSLLIVTSQMNTVAVDAEAHTARAEAGVLWHQVIEKAAPHGLAPLLGSSPHVGVIGYSLGGGIGWLARRYGLAADSVRAIDIVTADGELRHASPTENSDLFWGLRGGSGNFGVVTAIEFNLYPVPKLYGGSLIYTGDLAREALHFYRDWVKTVPDELTSSIMIVKFPAHPPIPEALRGKIQVIVRAAYLGSAADGQALMEKWLDWHTPTQNTFSEMPFSDVGTISNDPVAPTAGNGGNEMFRELSDAAIDTIVYHATNAESPLAMAELRHAGGAIARVPADSNAIGNRDANFYFQMGGPVFAPITKADSNAYLQKFKADLKPYVSGGVYLNFNTGTEAARRAKDAYMPASYERLVAIKAQYDPDNLFRFGYQLVKPK